MLIVGVIDSQISNANLLLVEVLYVDAQVVDPNSSELVLGLNNFYFLM